MKQLLLSIVSIVEKTYCVTICAMNHAVHELDGTKQNLLVRITFSIISVHVSGFLTQS